MVFVFVMGKQNKPKEPRHFKMEIRPSRESLSIFSDRKHNYFSVTGCMRFTKAAIKSIYFFSNIKAIPGFVDPNVKVRFV